MPKNKKSFLLHIDSLDVLDDLTNEQAGELFKAIKSYQLNEEIELNSIVKIAFSPFKNQFYRDDEKYQTTCKRRAEAGSLGGKQKVANASKCKQKVANLAESNTKNKNKTNNKTKSDNELTILSNKSDNVIEIFNHWVFVMKKNASAKLTTKREKNIKARLKDGYTVDQILLAIDGCSTDAFSMGANNNSTPYNDIELICRTGEKLESFIDKTSQTEIFDKVTQSNINNLQGGFLK